MVFELVSTRHNCPNRKWAANARKHAELVSRATTQPRQAYKHGQQNTSHTAEENMRTGRREM